MQDVITHFEDAIYERQGPQAVSQLAGGVAFQDFQAEDRVVEVIWDTAFEVAGWAGFLSKLSKRWEGHGPQGWSFLLGGVCFQEFNSCEQVIIPWFDFGIPLTPTGGSQRRSAFFLILLRYLAG